MGEELASADAGVRRAKLRPLPASLATTLANHRRWVDSGGTEGALADLTGADLSGLDLDDAMLHGARLIRTRMQGASLRRAVFEDAELSGALFTGADLSDANLRRSSLSGTQFRDANLENADVSGARGLLPGQLGGANLSGAHLPDEATRFESLANVTEASKTTQGLFYSILFVCAYAWLTVASTRDPQLLNNSAPAASRLPILGTDIPLVQFYLVAPLLLLALYIYFHLCLQRLWEELGELPAVFPDGRPLDKKAYPWIFNVLVRAFAPQLKSKRTPLTRWQVRMTILLGWGLVPLSLLVLWMRYLRSHDWWITGAHVLLLAVAIGSGIGFWRLAGETLRGTERRAFEWKRAWGDARLHGALTTVIATLVLTVISFGSIEGINPLSVNRGVYVTESGWNSAINPRNWVPKLLHACGYNPFAQLDDAALSTRPANWTGGASDHDFESVRGADCEGRNLRFAMAYNTFGVNGYFRHSDARGCDFRMSDLRYADFRESRLAYANFRNTRLGNADFRWADLTGARMLDADATNANFEDSLGVNLDLADANLSGANFTGSILRRANFAGANLKGTILAGADLESATGLTREQLTGAVLSSSTLLPADLADLTRMAAQPATDQNDAALR